MTSCTFEPTPAGMPQHLEKGPYKHFEEAAFGGCVAGRAFSSGS
jgi:hypothetical protein